MTNIFIATPMFGGICHGDYSLHLIKLLQHLTKNNIDHHFNFLYNESLITRARNTLVHEFLKGNYSHMLFLDADVVINPSDFIKMLESDKDIIGGCYPKKLIDWNRVHSAAINGCPAEFLKLEASEYVFNVFDGEDPRIKDVNIPMRVKNVGTGYMLIKRNVFEKLSETTPSYIDNNVFRGEKVFDFFETSINENHYLSEDYHFCKSWTDIDGEIYVAPWAKAKHIGMHNFG